MNAKKETKSSIWYDGYADGVWAQTFPGEFSQDPKLADNSDYQKGYQKGMSDSETLARLEGRI